MIRLRNIHTGVVVNVDEDTAAKLGAGYEPADKPKSRRGSPKKRTTDADDD